MMTNKNVRIMAYYTIFCLIVKFYSPEEDLKVFKCCFCVQPTGNSPKEYISKQTSTGVIIGNKKVQLSPFFQNELGT